MYHTSLGHCSRFTNIHPNHVHQENRPPHHRRGSNARWCICLFSTCKCRYFGSEGRLCRGSQETGDQVSSIRWGRLLIIYAKPNHTRLSRCYLFGVITLMVLRSIDIFVGNGCTALILRLKKASSCGFFECLSTRMTELFFSCLIEWLTLSVSKQKHMVMAHYVVKLTSSPVKHHA